MNIQQLMKQAQKIQEKMQQAQQEIDNLSVTGESGAGLVKVDMTGRYNVKRVHLDDSILEEEKEILEALIAAAINNAIQKLEKLRQDRMSGLTSGMELPPGMKLPLDDK